MPPKFSSRVAAFHVDALLFTIIFEFIHIKLVQTFPEGVPSWQLWGAWFLVTFVVFVFPTQAYGCTVGKKIYGLKVVTAGEASTPSWGALILREVLFKTLSSFLLGFGFWRARHHPDGKALYDDWTQTQVVSEDSLIENTALRVLFEGFVSLLTLVAGVALTLRALLYTSLPLPMIEEQLKTAGIEARGLTGSLAGGLRVREFKNIGESATMAIEGLEIHLDVLNSWSERAPVFQAIKVQSGTLIFPDSSEAESGVTRHFSWRNFVEQLLASLTDSEHQDAKFSVHEILVSRFSIEGNKFAPAVLRELVIEDFRLAEGVLTAHTFASKTDGLELKAQDLKYAESTLVISEMQGEVRPALLPSLQKPVDFTLHGLWETDSAKSATKLEGRFLGGSGSFQFAENKLKVTAAKVLVGELFKTQSSLQNLDLNFVSEGKDVGELLVHARATYHAGVCGHQFLAGSQGSVWQSPEGPVLLRLVPRNLAALEYSAFDANSTLDSLLDVQIFKVNAASSAMERVSTAVFCQKTTSSE